MALTRFNTDTSFNASTSLNGFSGFKGFGGSQDLTDVNALLSLAQQQGGIIAQTANELAHPTTSILSTIGDGFKKAFKTFVDVISVPSEVVAGIISPEFTVKEAIEKRIMPSDVIFGEQDGNATTLQKIGGFITRTATDILLDPLTYITFGVGKGVFGLRGATKVQLTEEVAKEVGQKALSSRAVSEYGQELYKSLRGVENKLLKGATAQERGLSMAKFLESGDDIYNLAGKELDELLDATIDATSKSPLVQDFSKKAISNLLTKYPHLSRELLDKGGMKVFGKTILEGYKIRSAMKLVPGMSLLDNMTSPLRNSVNALFDPTLIKTEVGGTKQWVRLPEEYVNIKQMAKDLGEKNWQEHYTKLLDISKVHKLNTGELNMLFNNLRARMIPADKRLAKAWMDFLQFDDAQLKLLNDAGIPVSNLDLHSAPNIISKTEVSPSTIPFKAPPSIKTPATEQASIVKFIEQKPGVVEEEVLPKLISSLDKIDGGQTLIGDLKSLGSIQEAGFRVAEFTSKYIDNLVKDGKATFEEVFNSPEVKQLFELRDEISNLPQSKQLVGDIEKLGLKPLPTENRFFDKSGKTYKRMAATLDEIKASGFEGFDTNLVTAHITRTFDNVKAVTAKNYVDSVSQAFGKPASQAPKGYVSVKSAALRDASTEIFQNLVTKDGEEILFHPAIAKDVESFVGSVVNDDAINELLRGFDKIQNVWKASVTSIFPAFHGRNAISNVFLHFMDLGWRSFDPTYHTMAADLLYKDRTINRLQRTALGTGEKAMDAKNKITEIMDKKMFTDASGYEWTFSELRQAIKGRAVAFNPNVTGAVDIRLTQKELSNALFTETGGAKAKQIAKKALPISQEFVPFKGGREFGRLVEEQARLVDFIGNLKATGDVELAAQRTKQFLFDYQNLTNFEKVFMRRIMPFYTFTRKNIELQAKSLLTTPGRVAMEVKALNTIGDVISGEKLTKEEEDALPGWIKDGIGILSKKRGSTIEILGSLGTPIEQPFQGLQPNVLLGSISPLIRVPVEQMSGYSFFQGKALSDVTNAAAFEKAPQAIKDFIGYTDVSGKKKNGDPFNWSISLRPERMNLLLNLPPTSRVLSAMKQIGAVNVSDSAKVLQQLIGIRPFSFDLENESAKRERELRTKLENLLSNAGVTAKFSRVFIPKN